MGGGHLEAIEIIDEPMRFEHDEEIAGYHNVDRVMVGRDESDEELQEKADTLARADEMAKFNTFHGSWVYKISKAIADKIRLTKKDLIQDKKS